LWIANFLGGGILLLLGCVFRANDAYDGLSGFSTMSAEEKKKWDIIGAGRFITGIMILSGVVLGIGGVLCMIDFYPNASVITSWVIMAASTVGGVIYINASGRFKRK
jgi:hypothetical protein